MDLLSSLFKVKVIPTCQLVPLSLCLLYVSSPPRKVNLNFYLPICQERVSLTVISLSKISSSSFLTYVSAIFPGKSSDNSMGLRQCCDRIQAWRSSKLFILVTITLGLFAGKIIVDLSNFVLMFVYAVL